MFEEAVKKLGAKGCALKESAAANILQSIHAVAPGQHYLSPALSGLLLKPEAPSALDHPTSSECRILKLIASDRSSKEIAEELGLSRRTVDTHMRRLREKLGVAAKYLDTVRGVGYRFVAD